jgi:hypothetical protein
METEFRVNASGAAVSSCDLTNGSSDRGSRLRWGKEGIDDLDKLPSFEAGEAPRRSTSSLGESKWLSIVCSFFASPQHF